MSNTFSVPIDMENLSALGRADIGHDDSLTLFDRQSTSYQSSEMFGFDSLAPQPYTFTGDATATSISCADLEQVDLPMDLPNQSSILDPSSQIFQPEETIPTSYVSNDVAAPVVTQSDTPKGWATEDDWTRHRALITELYGGNKLPKVMSTMESRKGFKATVKMYKTHIAKWGLDKKNKEPEMRAIVRKNKQRAEQGKRSNFRVRKRDLDFAEVVRYWKRKGVTVDEVLARSITSPTPETVECFTVVSSPITPPDDLATPEYILRIIHGYITASFESGTWVKTDPHTICYSIKDRKDANHAIHFKYMCYLARELSLTQNFEEAEKTLSAASAISRKMLLAEQPETIEIILERVAEMRFYRDREMTLRILGHLSATSKELLGESHPLSLFTAWLAVVPWSQVKAIVSRCFDVMIDNFESLIGPMHQSTLFCRLTSHGTDINLALQRRLLNKCESALGSYDTRTLTVRMELMIRTWSEGDTAEAKRMGKDLLAFIQSNEAIRDSIWYRMKCYECIANCRHALGELDQAIANLQAAIDLRMAHYDSQSGRAGVWLLTLEQWYIEQGDLVAAMIARDQRIRLQESAGIV